MIKCGYMYYKPLHGLSFRHPADNYNLTDEHKNQLASVEEVFRLFIHRNFLQSHPYTIIRRQHYNPQRYSRAKTILVQVAIMNHLAYRSGCTTETPQTHNRPSCALGMPKALLG